MTLILAHKKRKLTRDITIQDADGAAITPTSAYTVRVKIGRLRQIPVIDMSSAASTSGGSTITKNYPTATESRVEISQTDMDLLQPGIYSFEVSMVDADDGAAIKHVDHQIMVVQATQLGSVGTA